MGSAEMGQFIGAFIGGFFIIALLSWGVGRLIFGKRQKLSQRLFSLIVGYLIAVALASFGNGEGGFEARLANVPEPRYFTLYLAPALTLFLLQFVGSLRAERGETEGGKSNSTETVKRHQSKRTKGGLLSGSAYIASFLVAAFLANRYWADLRGYVSPAFDQSVTVEEITELMHSDEQAIALRNFARQFPNEHHELMRIVTERINEERPSQSEFLPLVFSISREFHIDFLQRSSMNAFRASDASLRKYLMAQVAALQSLAGEPLRCARYMIHGVTSADEAMQMSFETNVLGEAMQDVIASGALGEITTEDASDVDWAELGEAWVASGATDFDFNSVLEPTETDRNLCASSISYFKVLANMPGDVGHRVRASTVYEMISNQAGG